MRRPWPALGRSATGKKRTNFSILFLEWNSTCFGQFLCPSSGVFHCTHSNGICHTGLLTACEQDQDETSWSCSKLSAHLYDIYHCGRSTTEIVGSNPIGGMDICLLWVLCVVRQRSLRRADHSSRGFLATMVCRCVWSRNLKNEEAMTPVGSQRHRKKKN